MEPHAEMIYHAYTAYTPRDPETARRHRIAQQSWKGQAWVEVPIPDEKMPRLWKEEGRAYPYIRDMFDYAADGKQSTDIVIYTNADIHVRSDTCLRIACVLQEADACYCFRRDFGRLDAPLQDDQYLRGISYAGHDLTAFRVGWWRHHRQQMPDMIVGFEAWDPCMRILTDRTNLGCDVVLHDLIGHERHASFWEAAPNRYRLKGQRYNLSLAKAFMQANGINPQQFGIPERL